MTPAGSADRLALIRQRVSSGVLPTRFAQLWGGRGTGMACSACGETISQRQYEFEGVMADAGVLRLCQPCIAAWDEVRHGGREARPESGGMASG